MESTIITGVTASGLLRASPGLAYEIRGIKYDMPNADLSTASGAITLSGSLSGATTLHNSTDIKMRFLPNEDVYITTAGFEADHSVIVNWLQAGDMTSYMQTDRTRQDRGEVMYAPNFWRHR